MRPPAHLGTVLRVDQVTPAMRRVVLGGPGLAGFAVPDGALGPYLKLHLASETGRPLVRTYSVRSHDPGRGEVAIDMLLHGDGAGSTFAARAAAGNTVPVGGPGFIPAAPCRDYVLAGDHTALPAIGHILAHLPARASARVLIEIPAPAEEQKLESRAAIELAWLHRPEGRPSGLAAAVRSACPRHAGECLLWAGAEASIARAIRTDARGRGGFEPSRCQVLNYWKAGQPEGGFSYCD